jgi:hypothetical protein
MGQAVVWYGGQFYALFFLQNVLKVDLQSVNIMVAIGAGILGTPSSSSSAAIRQDRPQADHHGRPLIAIVTYLPAVQGHDLDRQPGAR